MSFPIASLRNWSFLLGDVYKVRRAALGSRWVNRAEVTRTQRIRMYDDLVPSILSEVRRIREALNRDPPRAKFGVAGLDELLRAATIAGPPDRRRVEQIEHLSDAYKTLQGEFVRSGLDRRLGDVSGRLQYPAETMGELEKMRTLNDQLVVSVEQFSVWLHQQIQSPAVRFRRHRSGPR